MSQLNGVSIITPTIRRCCIDRIIDNYINQEFDIKELIIIINSDDINIKEYEKYIKKYPGISVYKLQQTTSLGECLNFAVSKAKYDIIAKFDDDDYYSPYYLSEAYMIFKLKNCDIVGKCRIYCYLEELKQLRLYSWGSINSFSNWIAGATICFKKSIFKKIQFKNISCSEDKCFIEDCLKLNLKIYSTSSNNFIAFRGKDLIKHTWKITANDLIKNTNKVKASISYEEAHSYVNKSI
ncbi:MAG: glycosyltransferase [Peptostreptococcaceae bacterium]